MKALSTNRVAMILFLAVMTSVSGQNVPRGYTVPQETLSPDGRYGVTVPVTAEHDSNDASDHPKNSLIDTSTGQVLATIQAEFVGWDHMNHGEVLPARWSHDGSLLLWAVDGKWSLDALVLIKVGDGKVEWQTDVLKAAQTAILARTKQGAPEIYAAVKKRNTPHGKAFPEGFVVDATAVSATGELRSPTHFWVTLSSDPKAMGTFPILQSHLDGLVNWQGKFSVDSFYYGLGPPIRDEEGSLIVTSVRQHHQSSF